MKKPVVVSIGAFVAIFILHHDSWNWEKTTMVDGFTQVGLAYHVGCSIAA